MTTAERVLFLLKTRGPLTAQQLAAELALTSMGARRHLEAWQEAGLLQTEDRSDGRGRPARYWSLTAAGHARFPDRHSELTVQLLGQVRALFGEDGLDKLIGAREQQSETTYAARVAGTKSLKQRVIKLAQVRDEEGYMAQMQKQDDGSYLLIENHCPICAAATECQGLCRSELEVFRRVLGPECTVDRTEHAIMGARRCAYTIKPIIAS